LPGCTITCFPATVHHAIYSLVRHATRRYTQVNVWMYYSMFACYTISWHILPVAWHAAIPVYTSMYQYAPPPPASGRQARATSFGHCGAKNQCCLFLKRHDIGIGVIYHATHLMRAQAPCCGDGCCTGGTITVNDFLGSPWIWDAPSTDTEESSALIIPKQR
jgi:hypothetical protein